MAERSAPLSPAVFHILLALADGACHGYEIMTRVGESSGRKSGPGTVYGSIQRMEEAGLVSEVSAAVEGGRRRRYFELTGAGERALRQEAHRLTRLADLVRERKLSTAEGAGGSK